MDLPQPKIAFNSRWHSPRDFSDQPFIGSLCMDETGWGCIIYGYAASGKFPIYLSDNETVVKQEQVYQDAISLALGIYTIHAKHDDPCKRLICNCKVH